LDTIIAGVFIGNVLTAAFLWSMSKAARFKDDREIPWLVLWGLLLPIVFVMGAMFTSEGPPPFLDALAAQSAP
jgi:hypothetical protein